MKIRLESLKQRCNLGGISMALITIDKKDMNYEVRVSEKFADKIHNIIWSSVDKRVKSKMQSEGNYIECPIHDVDIKECKCKKEDIDEAVKSSEEYDKSKMQSKG